MAAIQLIKDVVGDLDHWGRNLKENQNLARHRERMVREGGDMFEGRRVGMDFFRNPRGPPEDLRRPKDQGFQGKYGLAAEYMGDRELANPWQWNCVWEEMGIPAETRKALERDEKKGLGGRVVRDNGIYPAAQGDARQKEAEDCDQLPLCPSCPLHGPTHSPRLPPFAFIPFFQKKISSCRVTSWPCTWAQ